jgi:hypothetical protein
MQSVCWFLSLTCVPFVNVQEQQNMFKAANEKLSLMKKQASKQAEQVTALLL